MSSQELLKLDAASLQLLLAAGELTSVQLVRSMLAQTNKEEHRLNAMIAVAPESVLVGIAEKLDEERKNGACPRPSAWNSYHREGELRSFPARCPTSLTVLKRILSIHIRTSE